MGIFFPPKLYNSRWLVCRIWPLENVMLVFYSVTTILIKTPWQLRRKQCEEDDEWYFKKKVDDEKPANKNHCTSKEQTKILNIQNQFWDEREKKKYQRSLPSWLENCCSQGCVAAVRMDPLFGWIPEIHWYDGVRKASDEWNAKGDGNIIKAAFSPETMRGGVVKMLLQIEENKIEQDKKWK